MIVLSIVVNWLAANLWNIISGATLVVSTTGVAIAHKSLNYNKRQEEPWKLVKLDEKTWLLERTSSVLATIYGDTVVSYGTSYSQGHLKQYHHGVFFKKGMKVKLHLNELQEGDKLILGYVEHRKAKKGECTKLSGYEPTFGAQYRRNGPPNRFLIWPPNLNLRTPYVKIWEFYLH